MLNRKVSIQTEIIKTEISKKVYQDLLLAKERFDDMVYGSKDQVMGGRDMYFISVVQT